MTGRIGYTILVCGVSGVGKTKLLNEVPRFLPSVAVWRASEIIGAARNILDPEVLRTLPTEEILQSQSLLVQGFEVQRREFPGLLVLLDAHSVIDSDSGFIEIPVDVAARFAPSGILHVSDDPPRILERRIADTRRIRPTRTVDQLREYQRRSVEVCEGYRDALKVPLIEVRSGNIDGFINAIQSVVTMPPRTG